MIQLFWSQSPLLNVRYLGNAVIDAQSLQHITSRWPVAVQSLPGVYISVETGALWHRDALLLVTWDS